MVTKSKKSPNILAAFKDGERNNVLNTNDFYTIRITKDGLSLDDTLKVFDTFSYVIVSEEGDGQTVKNHQHIMVGDSDKEKINKNVLRDLVKSSFSVSGNKEYMLNVCNTPKKLASYTVKDGSFVYKGFTSDQIKYFVIHSFEKDGFSKGYERLNEELVEGKIKIYQYGEQLLMLKAKYNQNISLNSHRMHMLSKCLKHGIIQVSTVNDMVLDGICGQGYTRSQKEYDGYYDNSQTYSYDMKNMGQYIESDISSVKAPRPRYGSELSSDSESSLEVE